MSGSLVLDLQTGRVCGLVKAATDSPESAEGWIVPSTIILETFPELTVSNAAEHPRGSEWWNLATRRAEFTQKIFGTDNPVEIPKPRVDPPPSWLLDPRNQIVRFHPRPELRALITWAKDLSPGAAMIKLICGPGGVGKTRLALELARQLHQEGWIAGIVQLDDPAEISLLGEVMQDAVKRGHRVLLALDYVEGYGNETARLARLASPESVRILLLARSAPSWWNLFSPGGEARYRVDRQPMTIGPIGPDPSTRANGFASALQEFRRRMDCSDQPGSMPPSLTTRAMRFGDVLNLHALALVTALHERDHGTPSPVGVKWRDPLDELVRHEERHLVRSARRLGLEQDGRLAGQVLLAPSLFAARNANQAREAIGRLPAMAGRLPQPVADLLHDLYPPPRTTLRWWGSLPLDRLAETLLAQVVSEAVDDTSCVTALFRTATMWQAVEGIVLLVRVSVDENFPEQTRQQTRQIIDAIVRTGDFALLGSLHTAEIRVYGESRLTAQYISEFDRSQALSLVQRMRDSGRRSFLEFALVLLDHVAELAPDMRERSVLEQATTRFQAEDQIPALLDRIAELAPDMRSEEKQSALDSAKAGFQTEHLVPMLMVLRAQVLILLERYTDAIRLTTRVIDALYPDVAIRLAHEIPPSTSVTRFSFTNDVVIASETAADNSEGLARALHVHAHALEGDERDDDGLAARIEGVAIARRAAAHDPDSMPQLIAYLAELAKRHIARDEDSLAEPLLTDVVRLTQSRAEIDTTSVLRQLANLRDRQGRHGQAAQLLADAQQRRPGVAAAVEVDPEPVVPPAVASAMQRSMNLTELGRLDEARTAASAAVQQLRELAEDDPRTSARILAVFLVHAAEHEPPERKLALARDAIDTLRNRPELLGPPELHDLAIALLQAASGLEALLRYDEALDASREAVQLLDQYSEHAPRKAVPRLATALESVCSVALLASQVDVAVDAGLRLAELVSQNADDLRVADLSAAKSCQFHLASALLAKAHRALDLGQTTEAHDLLEKSFESAQRFLHDDASEANAIAMVARLVAIGMAFSQAGDGQQAVAVLNAAISKSNSREHVAMLALAHWGRVHVLNAFAPFPEVVDATRELLHVCRRPGADRFGEELQHAPEWALSLARRPEARTNMSSSLALLSDLILPQAEDWVAVEALKILIKLIGDDDVPRILVNTLKTTLQYPIEPVAGAAISLIASKLPTLARVEIMEGLTAAVRSWSPTIRETNWRAAAPTLLLCGETLHTAGRYEDALTMFADLVDLLLPHRDEAADITALAIRRLIVIHRDVGRPAEMTQVLDRLGPDGLSFMARDAMSRADELTARARAAQERGDFSAAANLAGQALRECYASFDVARIRRGHLDYGHACMRRDPTDPACLASLVAAGVYGALIREPFDVDLAARLLMMQAGWHDIATIAQLGRRVDQTPGVSFGATITLATSPEIAQWALDEVLRMTVAHRRAGIVHGAAYRMQWDPYIAAIILARRGDHDAEEMVRTLLQVHTTGSWQHLAQALIFVLDHHHEHRARDAAADALDEALVGRCINALRGTLSVSPELSKAIPIAGLFSQVLRAMLPGATCPDELRTNLATIEQSGQWEGMVPPLNSLIAGERDPFISASAAAPVRAVIDLLLDADRLLNANSTGGPR